MKKLIRYLFYCFLGISLFFVFCNYGYADSQAFFKTGEELRIDANGNLVSGSYAHGSYLKYAGTKDSAGQKAYCSDVDLPFYGECVDTTERNGGCQNSPVYYSHDSYYSNSKECRYEVGGVQKNGDCSSIVGYIINAVESDVRYDDNTRWFRTQIAIWSYLANYGYESLRWGNSSFGFSWGSYGWVREYVYAAWDEYAKVHDVVSSAVHNDVNFDVDIDGDDKNFYYQPSTNSCDKGFYRTRTFKVINRESKDEIFVEIQSGSNDVEICYVSRTGVTNCAVRQEITILPNQSIEVFLKSEFDSDDNVGLEIIASYDNGSNFEYYDSIRWNPPENLIGNAQGMMTLTIDVAELKHVSSKVFTFLRDLIARKKCDDSSNLDNGTETAPVSKVCADKSGSKSDYTANFSGCACLGLDLGNNRYVNIVVTESAAFSFGNLTPNGTLYAGGGFSFAESGVITQYIAKVKWEYANKKNGVPYYYNGNNLSDWDARKIEEQINEALEKRLKNKLSLNFSTRDSNDYLNKNVVIVPLELDISNAGFKNGVYEFNSNAIKMHQAYFSSGGKVSYNGSNSTYSINGGNKYYVPMGYSEAIFPFNISASNLSIVKGINFWYEAECDKNVQDLYKSLYYRSIDLTNPFPKAGNLTANVPENWRFWYCGTGTVCNNITNRNRLENTYQYYSSSPLYEIVLDSSKFKKIGAMSDYYTSWSNINAKGVSSFITGMNLFEKYANDKSYCSIGVFSEDCDK